MRPETERWLAMAEEDREVAALLLSVGHNSACVFHAHLAVEKMLKALIIESSGDDEPPYSHNLLYLALRTRLVMPDNIEAFLLSSSRLGNAARYAPSGRYSDDLYCTCSKRSRGNLMVKTTAELNELVEELVRRLQTKNLPVERVLLWGRYATGGASDESDVRLIVISPALHAYDQSLEAHKVLATTAADLDIMIQAWGYTPEELQDSSGGPLYDPFLSMIVGQAREIYPTPLKSSRKVAQRNG